MTGLIELKLNELNQLFNSMDPSPFRERDLDDHAEEFIVSWASEHPRQHELKLVVHLSEKPTEPPCPGLVVSEAVTHYFDYRATMTLHELKRLFREGRAALIVGLLFLGVCRSVQAPSRRLPDGAPSPARGSSSSAGSRCGNLSTSPFTAGGRWSRGVVSTDDSPPCRSR